MMSPELKSALQQVDNVSRRLAKIESAMKSILQRQTIILAGSGALAIADLRPAEVLDHLLQNNKASYRGAFSEFLKDAASGQPIKNNYSHGCVKQPWTDEVESTLSFAPPSGSSRLVKRLDAIVVISIEGCKNEGVSVNNPAATVSGGSSPFERAARKSREELLKLRAPYRIEPEDYRAVMLGQAYRFASTIDRSVPVPEYIQERADSLVKSIRLDFLPFASNRVDFIFSFSFDRDVLPNSDQLDDKPKGWFNAFAVKEWFNGLAVEDMIYVSPTFVRAALVSCAKTAENAPILLRRLRNEVRPGLLLDDSSPAGAGITALTPADSYGIVAIAKRLANEVDDCVEGELRFLLAHELAHVMLSVPQEERADCIARSVTNLSGRDSLGVFDELIFQVARSENADMLGASPPGLKQIACREERQNHFSRFLHLTLKEAINACRSEPLQCERVTAQ